MILYRPVGHRELELLYDRGMRAFPPRLPDQPIFYPVLNAGYAREIAANWNTKSGTFAGYVTRFSLDGDYARRFEVRTVGAAHHQEFWVPAEQLDEFNAHLVGHVEVIAAYFGAGFVGSPPARLGPPGTSNADRYLQALLATLEWNAGDFRAAVVLEHKAVFCNYAYWQQYDVTRLVVKEQQLAECLAAQIADAFHSNYAVQLPTESPIFNFERGSL
jgi:hypothetical protein